jgi:hypothetical protein
MAKRRPQTLAGLKRKAWKLLSEVIRREAQAKAQQFGNGFIPCYTCGELHEWNDIQAGHAIPGRTGAVLFDEEVIRPQDYRCNVALRGNYQVFVPKLIKEKALSVGQSNNAGIAMEWWDRKLIESRRVVKWTRADLEAKISDYRARLQALG